MDDDPLGSIADHEAGHAVVAWHFGAVLTEVAITPAGHGRAAHGNTGLQTDLPDQKNKLAVALAGFAVDHRLGQPYARSFRDFDRAQSRPEDDIYQDDRAKMNKAAQACLKEEGASGEDLDDGAMRRHIENGLLRVRRLIDRPTYWIAIRMLGERLRERRTLSGKEATGIIESVARRVARNSG